MVAFTKFEVWSEHLSEKVHNLDTDTLKVYLSNTAPNVATMQVKADLAEITAQNGYPAGGGDTQNATTRTGAVTSVTGIDITFTAAGGSFGPFRYAVLYNSTPVSPNSPLIGFWDYGSNISINDTESFVVDFSTAVLTVS